MFDERITVVNNSKKGSYLMCAGCRTPMKKNPYGMENALCLMKELPL